MKTRKINPNCYCFSMAIPEDTSIFNPGKKLKKSADTMKQYNIIGIYPEMRMNSILIFIEELNDAKTLRNELIAAGYTCGRNIMTAYASAELTDFIVMEPVQ